MTTLSIALTAIIILSVILMGWLIKRYFSVNTEQMHADSKTPKGFKKDKPFFPRSTQNDGSLPDVITESNNELSRNHFDGVNKNPEH